jgi:gluconokinase
VNLLTFDISSSGVSAALFDPQLERIRSAEIAWDAQTLSIAIVQERFKQAIHNLALTERVDAICIGTFMHNCVLLDAREAALTPLFTWMDLEGEEGVEYIRTRLGDDFHRRTGCRYHPMFPVFKLAALRARGSGLLSQAKHIVSVKTFLVRQLTGIWIEDFGMASASGLYNLSEGDWDPRLLQLLGIDKRVLPPVHSREQVVSGLTPGAAAEFGLPPGVPVLNGSGDGFLAHAGSDCDNGNRFSISLGTSAVVRQLVSTPVLDTASGTFCYRADRNTYLMGCAGSNGGNVLNWGRSVFGDLQAEAAGDPPILIPLLHGERSPEWDASLSGSWHGLTSRHTSADLRRSVVEGVIFNLGHLFEIVQMSSAQHALEVVLSGNGFLHPLTGPLLAAILGVPAWMPTDPGIASLRGAALCAAAALRLNVSPLRKTRVWPAEDPRLLERYQRFKLLRNAR